MTSGEWLELLLQHQSPKFLPKYKAKILRSQELPAHLYGAFWKAVVVLRDKIEVVSSEEYFNILSARDMDAKFDSEIKRDINRTFPNLKFYQELNSLGQAQLFNVLKAYCTYNPTVGYCQGMGFVVGILLSHMDQVDAFNVLVALMSPDGDYCMQGLYKPGLPLLNKYLAELDGMISNELPRLSEFLSSLGIETSMFASQWILTLFVYNLEWKEARLIFNLFLAFKFGVILKFAIFILHRAERELLTMGFEQVMGKINDMKTVRVSEFIRWINQRHEDQLTGDQESDNDGLSDVFN